jgi:hypothetical protein
MNRDAVFEGAGDVVDLCDGQAPIHDAVAGHGDVMIPIDAPRGQSTTLCIARDNLGVYNYV